ncbi:MAG: hypothetical protein CL627_16345 [Aurantimonas sp.]|nr:hypothetical protein [Aurantimonas sp.]
MRHWAFEKDITKELILACFKAGISGAKMRRGGLPHVETIRRWRATDHEFDKHIQVASGAQPKQFDWEQVRFALLAGHSLSGLHKLVPNMPTFNEIAARGKANPVWYAPIKQTVVQREHERRSLRAERKSDMLRRLETGETLEGMIRRRLIGRSLLGRWRAADADFDAAIRTTIAERQAREAAQAAAAVESQRTQRLIRREMTRQRRLNRTGVTTDPIYAAAEKAVPRTYPKEVRDDVISSIFLAVIEGEINARDIPTKAKQFVSAYWRGRPEFHALSFDAPVGDSGGRLTLHDVIAQK